MAPTPSERDREMDRALRHSHSASSDHRGALIPMWDSSDPERAPPPLPLNPQSPVVVSRAGTSSAIQSAHAALTEKAREASMVPHPLVKRSKPETSPERSLLRGSTHRRMASVKDLSLMIEGGADSPGPPSRSASPEKTERPKTPSARPRDSFLEQKARDSVLEQNARDSFFEQKGRDSYISPKSDKDLRPAPLNSSPMPGPSLTPILRPAARRAPQSILGENNSPQSATMLALQNMGPHPPKQMPDTPLANITNGSSAQAKVPGSLDSLSNQILTLTSIATTLQKEMSQLSRRSRDNATDLLSLKEATNARDEDIRRSLRELITDAQTKTGKTRDGYGGALLLEGGDGGDGGNGGGRGRPRGWSFSDDGEGSHSGHSGSSVSENRTGRPHDTDRRHSAPATRAEDILGEDVLKTIRTIKDSVAQGGGLTAEVKALVRELRGEVLGMGREIGRRLDEVNAKHVSNGKSNHASKAEMTRIIDEGLDQMKQQMDNLLREHRRQSGATSVAAEPESLVDYDEVYKTVREALRDSQAHKPEFGKEDVIRAVNEAWEKCLPDIKSQHTGLERDEVFKCLQEGLQAYAPNPDRESAATREEVFQAVVEGLKHYVPPRLDTSDTLSRDQIVDAVRDCLEEFEFPVAPSAMGHELSRSDVVDAIREGLDEFEFPIAPSALGQELLSKNDVVDAVKECLKSFDFPPPPPPAHDNPTLTTENVVDAVIVGLREFDFSGVQSSALVQPSITKADVTDAVQQALGHLTSALVQPSITKAEVTEAVQQALGPFNKRDISDAVKDGVLSIDLPADVSRAVSSALGSFDFASVYSAALVPRSESSTGDVANAVKQALDALNLSGDVAHVVKEALSSFDFASAYSSALPPSSDALRVDMTNAVKQGLQSLDLKEDMARAVEAGLRAFEFPTCAASASASALVPVSSERGPVDTAAKDTTEGETSDKGLQELKSYLAEQFQGVSDEAKQNLTTAQEDTCLIMDATKDGFERLRQEIETYATRAMADADPGETMAQLVRTLEGFRDEVADLIAKSTESSRDMLRDEVASLRDAVNSSLVPALPHPSTTNGSKEFIEALHEGINTLRTDIGTRPLAGVSEIIDALQEGLGDIRFSIDKLQNKPVDLTANDEILEALREGLDGVRSEIDVLREEKKNDRSLATIPEPTNAQAVVPAQQPALKPEDIQKLESLLAQLGTKVASLESAPPPVVESVSKEDLAHIHEKLQTVADGVSQMPHLDSLAALAALEERVKIMQDSITELISREPAVAAMPAAPPAPARAATDAATHEDVEAIETILRNTKARLDDLIDGEQAVNKVHIDLLESSLLETRDMLSTLVLAVDLLSRKEDVTMVESLVTQIIGSFDDMKERHEKALEDPEKVTKTDIDAIEAICLDTKVVIEQMLKTDLTTTLASKEDLVQLQSLLKEYQGQVATRAETDTKALAVQQIEMASVGDRVTEVKTVLEEFQGIMRGKLEDGAKGIDAINGLLDTMNTTIRKNANISDDVKEMFDTMKLEFEDSRAAVVGAKMESDDKVQQTAVLLTTKLDERMAELFQKYDDFQLLQEERTAKGEVRDAGMEAAVVGSKAIAEELRSLIDTLGATVTDSLEKMEVASRTVFERVEDLVKKSEESYTDGKAEHQLTREQVQEVIGKVDGLKDQAAESEPKVIDAIQEVMLLVSQHYEHAKTSAVAIDEKVEEAKLQVLALPPPEKYDDTAVREKLDQLVQQTTSASTTLEQLGVLPNVYAQVKQTAAELAAFIAAQTQRIADEHEDKEKTLQETIVALERRLEEKKQVESHVATLREDEARLKESITVTLRAEQEQMKEQFLANLVEEEARLKSATADLRAEQDGLRALFISTLQEEQARMMEMNVALKEEQEQIKQTFLQGLKEEQARLMEMNVAIKEEQDQLKESFLVSLRDEQARLKEMNDALREEHQVLKDTLLANLREEESLLKEVNGNLREEQEELRKLFVASLQDEQQRLREANETLKQELKQEQEDLKATLKEDHERLKIELLANLMEEESRLKDLNQSLRDEQSRMREEFFATFKEEEQRFKDEMHQLRAERDDLSAQKARTMADLSATETALEIRRDNVQYMEAKAEGLERRILEGVVEHSKVLLMSRQKTASAPRESMSRKRVSSVKMHQPAAATPPKPRAAAVAAKTKINSPATTPVGSRRILSLSQMNNNVPTGGLSRSQSVKTPAGRPRKASWTPGAAGAAKGYGDLASDRNKENESGDLREEADEEEVNVLPVPVSDAPNPPPVDITISPASSVHGGNEEEEPLPTPAEDDLDADYDAISLDGDRINEEPEGVRRSSRGTTVITTPDVEEDIVYSDPEDADVDVDDAASDWTDSAMKQETVVGTEEPWEKKGY